MNSSAISRPVTTVRRRIEGFSVGSQAANNDRSELLKLPLKVNSARWLLRRPRVWRVRGPSRNKDGSSVPPRVTDIWAIMGVLGGGVEVGGGKEISK